MARLFYICMHPPIRLSVHMHMLSTCRCHMCRCYLGPSPATSRSKSTLHSSASTPRSMRRVTNPMRAAAAAKASGAASASAPRRASARVRVASSRRCAVLRCTTWPRGIDPVHSPISSARLPASCHRACLLPVHLPIYLAIDLYLTHLTIVDQAKPATRHQQHIAWVRVRVKDADPEDLVPLDLDQGCQRAARLPPQSPQRRRRAQRL